MANSYSKLEEVMKKLGLSGDPDDFDQEKYLNEREELQVIADSLPNDGVLDIGNLQKLQRLCIRGMNVCDDWLPRLHVLMTIYEVRRDQYRSAAYINATSPDGGKLTVESRKAAAEGDAEFNKMKIMVEKIKSSKMFHEKKKDTLKAAYYMFRDQLLSYKMSDKGNSGENLEYDVADKTNGKTNW